MARPRRPGGFILRLRRARSSSSSPGSATARARRRRLGALLRALGERTDQARRLATALALAEQQERRRISELLHDHVQQMLYGIQLKLKVMSLSAPDEFERRMEELQQLIDAAIDAARSMSVELSPPVLRGEGVEASISWLATYMERTYDLSVEVEVGDHPADVGPDMLALLVQLVRELLFNVVKHAGVTSAHVRIEERAGELQVEVRDEGVGFQLPHPLAKAAMDGRLGLQNVRERIELFGGAMQLWSSPGKGTRLLIQLPLEHDSAAYMDRTA